MPVCMTCDYYGAIKPKPVCYAPENYDSSWQEMDWGRFQVFTPIKSPNEINRLHDCEWYKDKEEVAA